jgi:hypothetical protein
MRVVYGAGAVAAMSVMAVGLVQPDWTTTADQGTTDDGWTDSTEAGAVAALPGGKSEASQRDPTAGKGEGARVNVRHVIRYVYLRPGQTAPPGATVVSATAPPPRAARNHPSNPGPTVSPRPRQQPGGNDNGGPVAATPRPTPRATQAPAATPQPTPRPTPKSRQSGRR